MKKPKLLQRLRAWIVWGSVQLLHGIAYGVIPLVLLTTCLLTGGRESFISIEVILYSLITTSWLMYPLIYPLRKPIRWLKKRTFLIIPLWIYLDDTEEHDWGPEWFIKTSDLKLDNFLQRFWASYLWSAVRNPIWNIQGLTTPKSTVGADVETVYYEGALRRNYKMMSHWNTAVLKWVTAEGEYSDNKGEFLSIKYSILGTMKNWYRVDGTLYFRHSLARQWRGYWIEIQIGSTGSRFTLRGKFKSNVVVYEKN